MRIAVVSPHLPTPAFPMRGVRHSEQLRLFAQAGHEVRAVVPLPWAPWRDVPRVERDGEILIAHPRYLRVPDRLATGTSCGSDRAGSRAAVVLRTAEIGARSTGRGPRTRRCCPAVSSIESAERASW